MLNIGEVHPAVSGDIAFLDQLVEKPVGLVAKYPILMTALIEQRDFLARRELLVSSNSQGHGDKVFGLMRIEGGEAIEALWSAVKKRERINGSVSSELVDWAIFASAYDMFRSMGGGQMQQMRQLEIGLGVAGIRVLESLTHGVNVARDIKAKVAENDKNWPEVPNQAPRDWDKERMATFHDTVMRPKMKLLRKTMRDRRMIPEVSFALNEKRENPPEVSPALLTVPYPKYVNAYLDVLSNIQV